MWPPCCSQVILALRSTQAVTLTGQWIVAPRGWVQVRGLAVSATVPPSGWVSSAAEAPSAAAPAGTADAAAGT